MKITQATLSTAIVGVSALISPVVAAVDVAAATAADSPAATDQQGERKLSCPNTPAWHPVYAAGWTNGYCRNTVDCDSPAYPTELACCKGAYKGQVSGACLKSLPNPPTSSPTAEGGLDVWYPDYDTAWTEAGCINDRPLPSGRPTYDSQLACCKGAYGGQVSGACLEDLPNPPTSSPTMEVGNLWYPDYDTAWSEASCKNDRPLPFGPGGRPTYDSQLECCKAAYGGQTSGACLMSLPNPPTTSPTEEGGGGIWYPDYDASWAEGTCKNEQPFPFTPGGRPTYEDQLACCKGAYGGQTSGACLMSLPNPPTTSPTAEGGLDFWYPDYDTAWPEATCKNDRPLPFNIGDRPTYDNQLACCKAAYGGQQSGACVAALPNPPTTSPTAEGGADFWYPDYDTAWSEATCKNDRPLPFGPGGRPTYDTQLECCKAAYGGQTSGACLMALPNPPTTSPTEEGGLDVFYPDYGTAWSNAFCLNDRPLPSGRPTYDSLESCCSLAYGGQTSHVCQCKADPCYSCKCTGPDSLQADPVANCGKSADFTC